MALWILLGVAAWLALTVTAVALCAAAGRADRHSHEVSARPRVPPVGATDRERRLASRLAARPAGRS